MAAAPQRRRPVYAISSVDNALRLLQMLRDTGEVRGKEAAEELQISPSTVHRLMSMLVYRGFAVQNESRTYLPGPSIGVPAADAVEGVKEMQALVRPHLARLRDRAQESAYFMILTDHLVRFLLTAQSTHPISADDRHGFVIPAHTSAGGRAILSTMRDAEVVGLYRGTTAPAHERLGEVDLAKLLADLKVVRSRGYAVSVEQVERGIVTVSAPVRHAWIRPRAAISLSGPVTRQRTITDAASVELLLGARDAIEHSLLPTDSRS